MVHNVRITFGAQTQPQIEIQQGDYNSRTIQALCYTSSGSLMGFEGKTVSVVYEISGNSSEEYPVKVLGNVLTFTMPGLSASAAGAGKLQLRIYGNESLLHSAVIPYTVKASLEPGQGQEDQVPLLVMLVQQAQQAIAECTEATDKANETVADIEQKLADGAFIGPTGPTGPQGYQGIGVTSASLDDQGELVFTVTDPATGGSSTLPPVNIDTSAAIQSVNQAAQEGVKQVQAARASAIAAVEQAGQTQITAVKNAGTQAVSDVTNAKNDAITDIGTAQSGAEAAITAAQESAVQTVQQAGTTAVGTVQETQNTATEAIYQAQQTSITAVENEGDAQVQRLKEIVPQPTADNNGMVVAVQSGAYQLENPAGLVLNDGVIASTSGWSSLQIANALCPPFSVSGPIVQCTPLANYPLDVQVEITPTQEGTGDPSPENVRPIVGWDAVNVWKGGKNLLGTLRQGVYDNDTFRLGSLNDNRFRSFSLYLHKGTYVVSTNAEISVFRCFTNYNNSSYNTAIVSSSTNVFFFIFEMKKDGYIYSSFRHPDNTEWDNDSLVQLELGTTPTAYEPYRGETIAVALGQTVYGGTLDVGTGTLTVTWVEKTIPDTNPSLITSYENYSDFGWTFKDKALGYANVLSSAFKTANSMHLEYSNYIVGRDNNTFISFGVPSQYASSPEQAGDYIRKYSPKVVYELATPEVIQLTPQQILAISGTNTICADASDITVTGASDPIATITALQNRLSALESAQTNM